MTGEISQSSKPGILPSVCHKSCRNIRK